MMKFIRNFIVLSLLLGVPVLAQGDLTIGFGDTTQGQLSSRTGEVEYTFEGEEGQFVTITMIQVDDMDPYLRLEDGDGRILAEDDDSAGSLNSRIGPFRLPANLTYTIVATSLSGSDTGAFTLNLETVVVQQMDYGQRISGELSTAEPIVEYFFEAEAGDIISIDMESDDFDAYLTLRSGDTNTDLAYNDDGGIDLNARLGPYRVLDSGAYRIVASGLGEAQGEFTLTLNQIDAETLDFNQVVEAQISGGRPLYFTFDGRAGQVIDVRADTGNTFDTALTLIGPSSAELMNVDDVDGGIDPIITNFVLPEDGPYFVAVQPVVSRDMRAPVLVKLTESRLPSLDTGPQTVQFDDSGTTTALLVFTGAAGERVTLGFTIDAADPITPNIRVRQGSLDIASVYGATIGGELSFGVTIPEDGQVIIDIQDYDYRDISMTVTVERQPDQA